MFATTGAPAGNCAIAEVAPCTGLSEYVGLDVALAQPGMVHCVTTNVALCA
jgi:hypothetical protein